MAKKLIAFDLDGTLAPSKSPLPDRIAALLPQLMEKFQVCVMSGGKFGIFETQLLANLKASPEQFKNFHLMPTCGTRYYRFKNGGWDLVYAEDLTSAEKQKITGAIKKAVTELDMWEKETWGETIEDRESQMSYSALGQDLVEKLGEEGLHRKEAWDPDNAKKNKIVDQLKPLLPEFEVRAGGLSTIDITKLGIDKAYGINKLMSRLDIKKEEILFMGDRIMEGGNDYPVKAMGVDCIEISHWQDTAIAIEAILHVV